MSLDLCLPFFLNQHSSLATLHAFSITMELRFLLEPLVVIAAALGSLLCGLPLTQPLNIWHLAFVEGVSAGHLQSSSLPPHLSLLISAEEGFSKPI